jgi:hypothetical protein
MGSYLFLTNRATAWDGHTSLVHRVNNAHASTHSREYPLLSTGKVSTRPLNLLDLFILIRLEQGVCLVPGLA